MKHRTFLATGLTLSLVSLASAQGITTNQNRAGGRVSGSAGFPGPRPIPFAIKNAPYSAEQIQEHTQTLLDGTHISQPRSRTKTYRDSQGRTRTERPLLMGMADSGQENMPMIVEIMDTVGGFSYVLDPDKKVAHRSQAQAMPSGSGVAGANGMGVVMPILSTVPLATQVAPAGVSEVRSGTFSAGVPAGNTGIVPPNFRRQQVATEKLPPQVIEGVMAEGTRNTITIPEGAQGNDRPISVVTETWMSPELKMVVLTKTTDPRSGETIMRLTNISRVEPDPTLFLPPVDYTVVDETGPFQIRYERALQ